MICLPLICSNFRSLRSIPASVFLLVLMVSLSGCSGDSGAQGKQRASVKKRAVPVTIGRSENRDVPVELRAIGTVEPYATVAIKSQVTGVLQTIHFKEGDEVKQGDPLFTIDPRPFTALLDQAQGALARDKAELTNARRELERYTHAASKGYVSTEQADQAATKVATLAATIKADEAAVENARLQLQFCTIDSPIDGLAGELMSDRGNLIKANADTAMVTINQISPIKVAFSVPGKNLRKIQQYRKKGTLKVLINGYGAKPLAGTFSFVDNTVNTATGTILLKAVFANTDQLLWPGQFVDVQLVLTIRHNSVVVPTDAIQITQTGAHVFVVGEDSSVTDRLVTTGTVIDGETVIESGIRAGERVVTDGQFQLTNGTRVQERPGRDAAGSADPAQSHRRVEHQFVGHAMISISDLFIRRPVMTVLTMLTILLFGLIGYKQLPVSDLPDVDFPDDLRERFHARSQPGHHGFLGCHRSGEGVFHHRRNRLDEFGRAPQAPPGSPSSSPWSAISIPPPRTFRPPSPMPPAGCRTACRPRPRFVSRTRLIIRFSISR